jgi:glycosyltransferase involved in cell wall biosynthesis
MKIATITAGAAGMFCGSCMKDNTLAAALNALGHEAMLLPTYTPIRTDEPDTSHKRVFFGGINVYLQQKSRLFRGTPWWFDRLLNFPRLLRWASSFGVSVRAEDLGQLTISMLRGQLGNQQKELRKLIHWFEHDFPPDRVLLSNILLSGMVPELKKRLKVPIIATLQGDDIFLEYLPQPYKQQALDLIRANCSEVDAYIATCGAYADFMAGYIGLPREKIHVVYPGLNLASFDAVGASRTTNDAPVIGYFARIAPEKGLHILADAFIHLRRQPSAPRARLRFSGWLGEHNRSYLDGILKKLADAGLAQDVEQVESPELADKVRFLHGLDVMSVPAPYKEPKGLYILEALAAGVPVVQPRHGSFPELLERTGGGLLFTPDDPIDLANSLRRMIEDDQLRQELGAKGRSVVRDQFTAEVMARETAAVLAKTTAIDDE